MSLLLAKAKKPFSLAEELIIPAVAVLAETLGDKTAADKIKTVPLSNDTFSRRIDKMRNDIVEQLVDKLQLDESVDVSGQVQLVALRDMWIPAAFANTHTHIHTHIHIFCKTLEGRTTGEDIFNIVYSFFFRT